MRTAYRPEPVREPEEILLVDHVQHLDYRTLDDLVLQRRDAERALPAVRLWYVMPARWWRPVRSSMKAGVKIGEPALEILAVLLPSLAAFALAVWLVCSWTALAQDNRAMDADALSFSVNHLNHIAPWYQAQVDAGALPGAVVMIARDRKVAYLIEIRKSR